MMTETDTALSGCGCGLGRATMSCMRHKRRIPGIRASTSLQNADSSGMYLGNNRNRYLRTTEKPANSRSPVTSRSDIQFGSSNGARSPSRLANSRNGCHNGL